MAVEQSGLFHFVCGAEGVAGTLEDDGFGHIEFGQGRGVVESERKEVERAGVGWNGVERVGKVKGEVIVRPKKDRGRRNGSYLESQVI